MSTLEQSLSKQPFFEGLDERNSRLVAGCARNRRFDAGAYLFNEGESADEFFLIRQGKVALEIAVPGAGPVTIVTLGLGQIVGASWLVPPYRWTFDARASTRLITIAIDAACLRGKCDEDHDLGYEMMKRFLPIFVARLHETRLQILDVYGQS